MDSQLIALLPVWYAAFLLSLTGHEAAHAWVARRGGDQTAYHAGQVTLNPWPHIRREPIGTIAVPLVTFFLYGWMMGWASAPYDPRWEDSHPGRAAVMSAAGPAANVFLFAIAFVALKGGLAAGWWVPPSQASLALDRLVEPAAGMPAVLEAIGRFLSVLFCLNLILGVFNLIPVPPLDGVAVLVGIVTPLRALYRRMRGQPFVALIGLLIAWRVALPIVQPILGKAVSLLFAS
jgi:Zn-dependent protease